MVYGYDAFGRPAWTIDALGHFGGTRYTSSGQLEATVRQP